ncbi:hypothetical protein SeLEV6574_g00620 [Synchytrium endobioticum]|uniref:Mitochondrial fission 1 protein n=1 Tax=Synchytrium endobioticum TaxID=286115 RepID=A0A507DH42_9FUNG|nr:hypothetical protein SeLEV6574_g00620 [Synchytrium endobioticum]
MSSLDESLPYAIEAETSLPEDEIINLRNQFEKEQPVVTGQTKFNYAWGLVRSRLRAAQEEGVKMLHEIYRETPSRRRECLYYLALGHYKLGNFRDARRYNETLLSAEPHNKQSLSLSKLIDERVKSEGLVGMAIVGGVVGAVGLLAAALIAATRR